MNWPKITFASLLVALVFSSVYGQTGPVIHFENRQHNFGQISEDGGPVRQRFLFENRGTEPLVMTNVVAGGGISVLAWTRNPVMPGDSGIVTIEFNPVNMPGRFNRLITVSATGSPSTVSLRLLGEVIPAVKTPEEMFPHQIGPLRLRSNHIPLGRVSPGEVVVDSVRVINMADDNLEISFTGVPAYASFRAVPVEISPGEEGNIEVTFDAGSRDEWGSVTSHARVLVNGRTEGRNVIYISANVLEDFSGMTEEEMDLAASITFDERVFNFGTLKQGETAEHSFLFTNTGESELIIRAVRSGCGCTAIDPEKTLLQPGDTSSIGAVFNSRGLRGRQSKTITVITNDPRNPVVVLRVTGEVVNE
ncbi:MAG: DUF1573 domain-containing protein [Marinilabiliales bacterium]|nr:MAG: DUF1573 domain-containing protein [Marinilabiliales bacterium]